MMRKYDPFLIVGYVSILGGLSLIPFSLAEGSLQHILTLSLHSWFAILFLALGCSLLGYYIWFHAVRQIGAAVTSSFLFAEPLVTALRVAGSDGSRRGVNYSHSVGRASHPCRGLPCDQEVANEPTRAQSHAGSWIRHMTV